MITITVSTLIQKLLTMPQDSKIWLEAADGELSTATDNVTYEQEYNHIVIHCSENSILEEIEE